MNIKELSTEIHKTNTEKGFWDEPRNIGELLMLIVTELSEALEAHRTERIALTSPYKQNTIGFNKEKFDTFIKDTFEDELADVALRLFDLAEGLNIDLEWHIQQKLEYNKTRPYRHGKKY